MPTTGEQWAELNAFICAKCGHRVDRHVVLGGKCTSCWAEGSAICEWFVIRPHARPAVELLLAAMQAAASG